MKNTLLPSPFLVRVGISLSKVKLAIAIESLSNTRFALLEQVAETVGKCAYQ